MKEASLADIFTIPDWSLSTAAGPVQPLSFSNGKTQASVVREVVDLIEAGKKIIFIHGVCGSGKSAIALNIARLIGRASLVVPIKNLQTQYAHDYGQRFYVTKKNGEKMKIAMITGRGNHDSLFKEGVSCADPTLPETIPLTDSYKHQLQLYRAANPFVSLDEMMPVSEMRRLTVAPANPYWSPIVPSSFPLRQLADARKHTYTGADNREYTFYHRKKGCAYYDQYLSYLDADVLIFNAAKYQAELALGRKPRTKVDIIDEADAFLDGLFNQRALTLSKVVSALRHLYVYEMKDQERMKSVLTRLDALVTQQRAVHADEQIFPLSETPLHDLFSEIVTDPEFEAAVSVDEQNYAAQLLSCAKQFADFLDDVFVSYTVEGEDVTAQFASINLSAQMRDLREKTDVLVCMSGTIHSQEVLTHLFGITDIAIVEAETSHLGSVDIVRTGKEIDCRHAHFSNGRHTRHEYLTAFDACLHAALKPTLIHVHAFGDLPEGLERETFDLPSREQVRQEQMRDSRGRLVASFKSGERDQLFTTRCSRGIDFPGAQCHSIVFTKYPNPPVRDPFWRILHHQHPDLFWNVYKDKARREFLQRLYRGLRSKDDHVYVLSPDTRVLDAVRVLQEEVMTR